MVTSVQEYTVGMAGQGMVLPVSINKNLTNKTIYKLREKKEMKIQVPTFKKKVHLEGTGTAVPPNRFLRCL